MEIGSTITTDYKQLLNKKNILHAFQPQMCFIEDLCF